MERRDLFHYLIGYLFGGSFFLILIPGLIYAAGYITGPVLHSPVFTDDKISAVISLILFIPGIVFMIWSNAALFFIGKGGPTEGFGVEISPKTKVLVTSGPYRYTRNPMVFGAYSIYLAFAFFLNSSGSLILAAFFLPVIIFYLKKSEEKRLQNDFGDEFLKYRERVSLLIPLPPKK